MRVIEFKLKTNSHQEIAIQEAIRVAQFIRNKCLRFWMDSTKEDQVNYGTLCRLTTEFIIVLNFLLSVNLTLWLVKQVPKELGFLYPVFTTIVKGV
jgi:transposase